MCTAHQIVLGCLNRRKLDGRDKWHVREAAEVHTAVLCGDLSERDHLEYVGIDGRIILIWIFRKWVRNTWTGLLWSEYEQVAICYECGNKPSNP